MKYEREIMIEALKKIAENDRFNSGDIAREVLGGIDGGRFTPPEPSNGFLRLDWRVGDQTWSAALLVDPGDDDYERVKNRVEQLAMTFCGFHKKKLWKA